MKRLVPVFGVPLILAASLGQGDTGLSAVLSAPADYASLSSLDPLPGTLAQIQTPRSALPNLRVTPLPKTVSPFVQPPRTPGDAIPHSYMVYGLRTGPGGMAFTSRDGAVIPMPSNPQIILKPFNGFPVVPPPTYVPRLYTFPRTLTPPTPKNKPTPKK